MDYCGTAQDPEGLMRFAVGFLGFLSVLLTLASPDRVGNFRDRLYAEMALVQVATTRKSTCEAADKLAVLFSDMNEAQWLAIDDRMIAKMSALLDQSSYRLGGGCIAYVMADVFLRLGPRANAAVPALERALYIAELARDEAYERGTRTLGTPKDCLLFGLIFGMNFDGKLDYQLRNTLWFIDGRQRAVGHSRKSIKCPRDGDPPG